MRAVCALLSARPLVRAATPLASTHTQKNAYSSNHPGSNPVDGAPSPLAETKDALKSPDFRSTAFKGMQSHFPCLQELHERSAVPIKGLKGVYGEQITGYTVFKYKKPFHFKHGGVLPEMSIAYETWGELNEAKNNCILLHTGLSGSSHAKSHHLNQSPGWWEKFIGPGAPLDTNKFFIVCANLIGGCFGSSSTSGYDREKRSAAAKGTCDFLTLTAIVGDPDPIEEQATQNSGPSSINPESNEEYGTSFPLVTVEDMVRSQFVLLEHLGVSHVHATVGASLGGMLSLQAAVMYPESVGRVVSISSCTQSHPSSIAMRYVQRRILMADPSWNNGHYYGKSFPVIGMQHARELATISYRSGPEWQMRFGQKRANPDKTPDFCPDFEIERYLDHQGEKFCKSYDPNSLLYISKAMDLFNVADGYSTTVEGLARVKCPILVIGVTTDVLFPVHQQREMAQLLQEAGNEKITYYEINSIYGHDTFLLDLNNVGAAVKGHLEYQISS